MAQEIERKFLVIGEYKSLAFAKSRIVQGYISSARGRTVRIRIRDDKGYLTIKGASNASGTSRYELEKELSLIYRKRPIQKKNIQKFSLLA